MSTGIQVRSHICDLFQSASFGSPWLCQFLGSGGARGSYGKVCSCSTIWNPLQTLKSVEWGTNVKLKMMGCVALFPDPPLFQLSNHIRSCRCPSGYTEAVFPQPACHHLNLRVRGRRPLAWFNFCIFWASILLCIPLICYGVWDLGYPTCQLQFTM